MRNVNTNESGRSMIEMLGVIVVIIIIAIGSLAGFSYLMQHAKRNETVRDVVSLIDNVKTADLARGKPMGELIKANKIVKGARLDAQGERVQLADANDSFAVVYSMGAGSFAVAFQVEPGTCSSLMEALVAEQVSLLGDWDENDLQSEGAMRAKYVTIDGGKEVPPEEVKAFLEANPNFPTLASSDSCGAGITGVHCHTLKDIASKCRGTAGKVRAVAKTVCPPGMSTDNMTGNNRCAYFGCGGDKPFNTLKGGCCGHPMSVEGYCNCPEGYEVELAGTVEMKEEEYCQAWNNMWTESATKNDRFSWSGSGSCTVQRWRCVPAPCDPDEGKKYATCHTTDQKSGDKWLFSKHVCISLGVGAGTSCVECGSDNETGDGHCRSEEYKGSEKSDRENAAMYVDGGSERRFDSYCINAKCRECTKSYEAGESGRDGTDVYCPVERPNCNTENRCECPDGQTWNPDPQNPRCECPSPLVWNETEHKCTCPTSTDVLIDGLCCKADQSVWQDQDGKLQCAYCKDDHANNNLDSGCGDESPICYIGDQNEANDKSNYQGGYNLLRTDKLSCVRCIMDSDCGSNEYCDSYLTEYAGTAKAYDYTCKPKSVACTDDHAGGEQDDKCTTSAENKLCVPERLRNQNGTNTTGIACVKCFDSNPESSDPDDGCEEAEKPLCEPKKGSTADDNYGRYGESCHRCQNTSSDNHDLGCDDSDVGFFCSNDAGEELADKAYGTKCYMCKNDQTGATKDFGCDKSGLKLCATANGVSVDRNKYGTQCYKCQDNASGDNVDYGCSDDEDGKFCGVGDNVATATNKYAPQCYKCFDDAAGDNADTGCPVNDNGSGDKFCGVGDNVATATNTYGGQCYKCFDSNTEDTKVCKDANQETCEEGTAGCTCSLVADMGCPDETPVCRVERGEKYGTTCDVPTPPCDDTTHCLATDGSCVDKTLWQDLQETNGPNGECLCVEALRTNYMQDAHKHSKPSGVEGSGYTRLNNRTITYSFKAKFYCPRYLAIDNGVDDFVYESNPAGIGDATNQPKWWSYSFNGMPWYTANNGQRVYSGYWEAFCSVVAPKISAKASAAKSTTNFSITVKDYWLSDLGYNGRFYFLTSPTCPDYTESPYKDAIDAKDTSGKSDIIVSQVSEGGTSDFNFANKKNAGQRWLNYADYKARQGDCPANKVDETCGTSGLCEDRVTNKILKVADYVDIYRDNEGYCACYDKLTTNQVNDNGNTCKPSNEKGKRGSYPNNDSWGWNTVDYRRTSLRKREYKVPAETSKFYCTYAFKVSDNASADDFVVSSASDGIGSKTPHNNWESSATNDIRPRTAKNLVHGSAQKTLVVQDIWLREVGFKGKFEFVLKERPSDKVVHGGTKTGISYSAGWASGSSKCSPICNGPWRKKEDKTITASQCP